MWPLASNAVEINKQEMVLNNISGNGGWVGHFQQSVFFLSNLMSTWEAETLQLINQQKKDFPNQHINIDMGQVNEADKKKKIYYYIVYIYY